MDRDIEEALDEKPKKKRKTNPDEPPAWFLKFHQDYQKEKVKLDETKVPAKEIKQQAKELAHVHWQDPQIQQRAQSEFNNHQARLFGQIFVGRRL